MLRAVLFDLDGTLIDWSQSRCDVTRARHMREVLGSMLATLELNGQHPPPLELVAQEYNLHFEHALASGRNSLRAPHLGDVLVDTLAAAGMPRLALDRQVLLKAFPWTPFPGIVCFPDAPDALRTLRDHGIRVGLVTNSVQPMWMRDRELSAFGLLSLLPTCRISAADVGWLKPHPRIFEAALACLGVQPQEAVFVGDNPVPDIAGAQNAGMRGVLRSGRHDTLALAGLIEPDHRLCSLEELPIVLDSWFPGWRQ